MLMVFKWESMGDTNGYRWVCLGIRWESIADANDSWGGWGLTLEYANESYTNL